MGKRKSQTIQKPKNRKKLDKVFDCPFCNHVRCVETSLDKKTSIGTLFCRICSVNFVMKISPLTEPIDIYSHWMDRCREENKAACENAEETPTTKDDTNSSLSPYSKRRRHEEMDPSAHSSEADTHTQAKSRRRLVRRPQSTVNDDSDDD